MSVEGARFESETMSNRWFLNPKFTASRKSHWGWCARDYPRKIESESEPGHTNEHHHGGAEANKLRKEG